MFMNYCMATKDNVNVTRARYERKFFISHLTRYKIESIIRLHPAAFSEIYYERTVNNIYLDSFNMKNYFDNVSGSERRTKVRVRWYGDLLGNIERPKLELKMKEALVSNKISFHLDGFSIDGNFSRDTLHGLFKTSQIPDVLKLDLICLDISLFNSYRRKYYLSSDGRYRITLDSDLEFYEHSCFKNSFLNRTIDRINTILEVKYDTAYNEEAERVTSYFPFRMTKSSKYIVGLERLNLMRNYSHV